MKRRFVSILMALVMALSLLPAQALAEDNTVTELNKNNISNGLGNGTYKLTEDVTITNTLTITGNTTLDLNNRVLQMTGSGSVFKIESTGRLTLEDNAATKTQKYFDRNDTTGLWSWRTDNSTSAYSVSGGIITGGTGLTDTNNNGYGGGVYVDGSGQFTMTGGNIVGCKAEGYIAYGGGVFVAKGGHFTMTGGSITGCTAVAQGYGHAYGGGIRNHGDVNDSNVGHTTLSGTAEIRDCHAKCANDYIYTSYGGGVSDAGTLTISGDVTIIGCTDGGQGSDAMYINANNGSSVTGGTFYGSVKDVGNKITDPIVTYQVNDANYATQVVPSGETATQPADPTVPAGQTFDGWYKADGTEWNFTNDTVTESLTLTGWLYVGVDTEQAFTNALADNSIDVIRLTNDITLTIQHPPTLELIRNGRQVTLDLNGHVLDLGNTGIAVGGDSVGSMTIIDSRPNEPHKFTPNDDGPWVLDGQNGTETVLGGIITNSGSAIHVGGSGGKVIMNGGNIVGCGAGDGGAVSIVAGGQFTMNAGSIAGCKASGKGGGVYLLIGTFELAGGVIKSCKAGNKGGAVYVGNKDGIFTMTGGSIEGCKAANGSALCLYGKMEANGGTVDGTVVLDTKENHGIHQGIIQGSGTNATQFNGAVTNDGTISHGTFNGTVENTGALTGGTYNGEVINNGTINDGVFTGIVSGNGKITGGTFNPPMTGSGTKNDPYQISTADQLKLFRDKVNSSKTSDETKICVVLTADIDLKNEAWTPIGIGKDTRKEDLPYSGTFDGNGHTISGLNVNYGDKNGGLFCHVKSATIKNLTVAGSVTYSSGDGIVYGGIVGCANSSTIENCTNRCTVTGTWYAGGIVGWSVDSDIIGCANFGNISSPFRSGGICGRITGQVDAYGIDATIRDCYNVGMVSGKYAGGITGQSDSGNIDILIANCYNVGSLHGSTNTGEIIGDLSGPICTTIDNCYYLPTGNPASTSDRVNVKRTDSKTAAEFADGTVRKLLKAGERDNNADPWADECQYLAAADKTLPVFNGQGDAHDHQSNDWESNETEHWQVCTCGAVFHKAQHSGGTATCTQRATCTVCGAEYGEKLPHDFTAETVDAKYLKSAATCTEKAVYYKSCAVCGLSSEGTADEATFFSGNALGHDWGDWTPSSNKTHTRTCKTDSTHTETKNCADDNKDHVCDTCGATLTQHSGGTASCTAQATCGYCGKPYGEKNPANHSDLKHVPAKAATTQAEGNSEYWLCSGCGKCYKDAAAATEIALSDTVIAKRIPRRYSGPTITVMGAAYYDGGNVGLTFVSSADFDTFTGVQVDGKTLAAKNYIAERGSIEVYLKAVYLRTLKNGSHTVTIQSTAGDVSAVFTVENSKTSPGTSDPGVAVYALSSMLSLTGLAALRRRKED